MNELLEKYHLIPKKITIKKGEHIITTEEGTFLVKPKVRQDIDEVYRYLESRDFLYFVKPVNDVKEDEFEIYPFFEEISLPKSEKAEELIYVVSLLHTKTTYYEAVSLDEIKKTYEEFLEKITYLDHYYHELQDVIESHVYMSPSEYFLIRNLSQIYMALSFCRGQLEKWYEIMKERKKKRMVLLHNNLGFAHFLGGKSRLTDWDATRRDSPIYDLLGFYKSHYREIDFASLLRSYEAKYPLLPGERALLFVHICLPWKITLEKNEYEKCNEIERYFEYLSKGKSIVLEQNEVPATK